MRIVGLADIDEAAAAVDAGGLVVVPTRRWYMLCGRADRNAVATRIFGIKKRPTDRSLLYVARSYDEATGIFAMNDDARLLADAFWPGDLALLLPWRKASDIVRMEGVGDSEA